MLNTKQKGSAAVEMIYILTFMLAFIFLVREFSILSHRAHQLSVNVQNRVEKKMIDAGRPPCLIEEFGEGIVRGEFAPAIFGDGKVRKGLVFATDPYCQGDAI